MTARPIEAVDGAQDGLREAALAAYHAERAATYHHDLLALLRCARPGCTESGKARDDDNQLVCTKHAIADVVAAAEGEAR